MTTTAWPTAPDDGCRLVSAGAPPGTDVVDDTGTEVVVELVLDGPVAAPGAGVVGVEEEGAGDGARLTRVVGGWESEVAGGGPLPNRTDPSSATSTATRAADTPRIARRSPRSGSAARGAV